MVKLVVAWTFEGRMDMERDEAQMMVSRVKLLSFVARRTRT